MAAQLENMLNEKVKVLESKFQNLEKEMADLKDDYGLEENSGEDIEAKVISMAKDELGVEIKAEEIEIARRIGQACNNSSKMAGSQGNPKPRSIIVKFARNKTKMKLFTKRKLLIGNKIVIVEDMATDIAKRLKKLKEKASIESAWFVNGKIKYKIKMTAVAFLYSSPK